MGAVPQVRLVGSYYSLLLCEMPQTRGVAGFPTVDILYRVFCLVLDVAFFLVLIILQATGFGLNAKTCYYRAHYLGSELTESRFYVFHFIEIKIRT